MKTPDEIKKGLEYCVQLVCPLEECPYYDSESCAQDKTYDALAYIQQLETANAELLTKVKQLEEKCHQLERERDAAVKVVQATPHCCEYCKHHENGGCDSTPLPYAECFEWRGVKEE